MADDTAWRGILQNLITDLPVLVDDFLQRLAASGSYDDTHIRDTDLRETASETLEFLIRRLSGQPMPEALTSVPRDLGVRRARQGISRDALMDAVRLDFRVLWAGLARADARRSPTLLVNHAEEILTTVEQYIGDVQVAFLHEQATLSRNTQARATRAVAALLNARPADRADVAHDAAQALGIPSDALIEVAAICPADAEKAHARAAKAYRGHGCVPYDLGEVTLFIHPHGAGASLQTTLHDLPGGYEPQVEGLIAVPDACRLVIAIAPYGSARQSLLTEDDAWPALAQAALAHDSRRLTRLADALRAADEQQQRVIDTTIMYCRTGSIQKTSQRMYCHRNTVVNHLRQFQEITGIDVTIPVEAARALIALGPRVFSSVHTGPASSAGRHP